MLAFGTSPRALMHAAVDTVTSVVATTTLVLATTAADTASPSEEQVVETSSLPLLLSCVACVLRVGAVAALTRRVATKADR